MADVFTKEKRSEVMSRIRGRGNRGTELALVALFRATGISGWRRHLPMMGRPDFAFRRARVAIFVDGCFWHSCPRCASKPETNAEFWAKKLDANRKRDRVVNRALKAQGWRVLRIWEHSLKKPGKVLKRVRTTLETPSLRTGHDGRSKNDDLRTNFRLPETRSRRRESRLRS
jgi:DNA mismatch endonuclease (patch repair protein)